jgi:sterol desaturase/sphingolipid hydroxylase (fatty acid hydroxylase superfamily)
MPLLRFTQEAIDASQGRWPAHDPSQKRKDRPKSIRVIDNWFFENVLGKAHPITPIVWFGPLITYGIYRAVVDPKVSALGGVGLFLAGWLLWTLTEYLLHRFVFHMGATTDQEKMRAFLTHGYHHEFPDDGMRLVAPPLMSWGPAVVICTIAYFVLGRHYWATTMAGTAVGYVGYDWIHYYTHHGRPKRGLGKWLRRYHMLHHFADGSSRYGVSTPIWDLVFGTFKSPKPTGNTAPAESLSA